MELKKSDKANLDKRRSLFIEIGLLVALGFVLLAFEWQVSPKEEEKDNTAVQVAIEEEIVPITRQDEPPPPAVEPPKVTDILDIVENDVQVDTNIDINMDVDLNTEIVPVLFEAAEIVEEEEEVPFSIVEDKPLFNGKDAETGFREYVNKVTRYPPVAQENGITGRVYIEFSIGTDGQVSDVKVLRGADPLLNEEAERVVKSSPKWTPGKQRGKPVKVKYQFPFYFQLQ